MGNIKKRITVLAGISLLLCFLLSGCFLKSGNDLYAVPHHADQEAGLETAISALAADRAFCAPTAGENRQTVQRADLDGNGDDEVLVFLKESGADLPLQVHILNRSDGFYRDCCAISADGSDFRTIEYVQLDGEPGLELLLTRQISPALPALLNVYSFRDKAVHSLLSTAGADYAAADLDADGTQELLLFRAGGKEPGLASLYSHSSGELVQEQTAELSAELLEVEHVQSGNLVRGVPAVFVSGRCADGSIVTDVLALRNGIFTNLTALSADAGDVARCEGSFFAADVDSDGVMELPHRVALQGEAAEENTLLCWYSIDPDGNPTEKLKTCQDSSSGWFLTIPDLWSDQFTVRTLPDGGVCFLQWRENDDPLPILTIYTFSGEGRNAHGVSNGRFILAEKGDVTYSAIFGTSPWVSFLTQEQMKQMFNFIHSDWITSET